MLTVLKVPSLACKGVFYGQEQKCKGIPWNWILKILKYAELTQFQK